MPKMRVIEVGKHRPYYFLTNCHNQIVAENRFYKYIYTDKKRLCDENKSLIGTMTIIKIEATKE